MHFQNWMILAGVLVLFFGMGSGGGAMSHDDDDWDASEMNKEGMNYKE